MVFGGARVHIEDGRDQFEAVQPPSEELQLIGRTEGTTMQASPIQNEIVLAYSIVVTAEEWFGAGLCCLSHLLRGKPPFAGSAIG